LFGYKGVAPSELGLCGDVAEQLDCSSWLNENNIPIRNGKMQDIVFLQSASNAHVVELVDTLL